ncbi:hypothetical protein GPECTOR_192g312 [Gonium pectorale]|uniref:RRM domain-containing protein n=1 Tax=Gonium pectorale TaxID=33097 RepID=A0A150FX37_GONPE|nr:hypothetical protein GPECTOR_192g312 [Gonium pectorale]|eukprot:KXZ42166.1 hypothetical protein GPECTOR_192g312 [Gonium pectorale]
MVVVARDMEALTEAGAAMAQVATEAQAGAAAMEEVASEAVMAVVVAVARARTGDITDEELRNHFSQYGEIQDSVIMRKDGVTRGFGFVTFADPISVEKVLVMRQVIRDKTVDCKRATPRESTPSTGGGRGGYGGRGGDRGYGGYGGRGGYGGGYGSSYGGAGGYGGGRGGGGYGGGGYAEGGMDDGMSGYGMAGYGNMTGMAYAPAMAYGGYGGYTPAMAYGVMGYGGYGRATMARNTVGQQQRFRPY